MKKEYKVLVLSFVFVFMFSSLAHAMTYQEFMDMYPNDCVYRVDFPTGDRYYFSSSCELEFTMEDVKGFVVLKCPNTTAYYLTPSGHVGSWSGERLEFGEAYEYVDIYRWSGNGFFLPEPSAFLRPLGGLIRTILPVGFGIMSAVLLVKLLTGFFRRYMLRW